MTDWLGGENDELAVDQRWPLAPTHLLPRERHGHLVAGRQLQVGE